MNKYYIKKLLGLKNSDLLDWPPIQKKIAKKLDKYFYKNKYETKDIIQKLKDFGIGKGSNIFIHSSWDSFDNYNGSENELIDALVDLIGPNGTLVMPAMPLIRKKIFDVRRTVTKAGLLAESFRHYPGVERSINVRHSVCAYGPLANELICSHHRSLIRFDENSPFYKMCQYDFKVVSLGLLPYFIGTIIHCVEATMWREMPYFREFYDFDNLIKQPYIDSDGKELYYLEASERGGVRSVYWRNQYIIWRYFDKQRIGKCKLSNLNISYVEAPYTYEKLCELARKGVVLYVKPYFHK